MAPFLCSHDTFLGHSFQYCHSFWLLCCFEYMTGFFGFLGGGLKKTIRVRMTFPASWNLLTLLLNMRKVHVS